MLRIWNFLEMLAPIFFYNVYLGQTSRRLKRVFKKLSRTFNVKKDKLVVFLCICFLFLITLPENRMHLFSGHSGLLVSNIIFEKRVRSKLLGDMKDVA